MQLTKNDKIKLSSKHKYGITVLQIKKKKLNIKHLNITLNKIMHFKYIKASGVSKIDSNQFNITNFVTFHI